jgi:hypothetical protein
VPFLPGTYGPSRRHLLALPHRVGDRRAATGAIAGHSRRSADTRGGRASPPARDRRNGR